MALLVLTFMLSRELENEGIKVNALQINGAKLSPETMRKFSPKYRFIGRIQSLFLRPPEYMADRYYQLCTSESYSDITGKLFNDKLEVMKPAYSLKPGLKQDLRQALGSGYYPLYAEDENVRKKLWDSCLQAVYGQPGIGKWQTGDKQDELKICG